MTDILTIVKAQLKYDTGSGTAEWLLVEKLLTEYPAEQDVILRWVYAELPGYTWTRVQAGQRFIASYPNEGWQIIERLVQSEDPDDRDTALSLLIELNDPRGPMLARPMLLDPWPYLQFEAVDYLKDVYPTEVHAVVLSLLQHEQPEVRKQASAFLDEFNAPGNTE